MKGYVTLNTLVFNDELPEVESHVRAVATAGVDAVLVQDLGVTKLIKAICPDLPIHASTQMSLTSAECIRVAGSLGIERVVLARELSVEEIRKIGSLTDMPLETFVHGALCVAYSGQCLTSESLGGRSANRGQCAQACRMTYELICDGEDIDLGEQKYLLSPQDLAAYDLIPDLISAGVVSFKIEGRLKTPEYVANITRHYRQAIDAAILGKALRFSPAEVQEMELSFSRGFSHGWLDGNNHKRLVPGLSSSKRGVLLGRVCGLRRGRVEVDLAAAIKPGDGIVFAGNRASNSSNANEQPKEQGGRVYEVFVKGRREHSEVSSGVVELAFAHGGLDFATIWSGQQVWKTDDPQLTAKWKKSYNAADPLPRVKIDVCVHAEVGKLLTISATTESGGTAKVESEDLLALARKYPATEEMLRTQLDRLGGSVYVLGEVSATIIGGPMIPLSVLSGLRQELIRRLDALADLPPTRRISEESVLPRLLGLSSTQNAVVQKNETQAKIHVLCRSLKQLSALLECGVDSIYADFQDIREYGEAVTLAHAEGAEIFLTTPRIQKPGEMGIFHAMAKHNADGMLVRNFSGMEFFREKQIPFVADFSFNITNALTAEWVQTYGPQRLTASYDMNRDQLLGLVAVVDRSRLELVVHQHMPMFHMEHCVFCAVLSPGTDKTNCGRPCDFHQVKLRDRIGMEHPLKADVACRNTLFNAVPQSAAEMVPVLLDKGVRHFRIELLDGLEDEDHPRRTIGLYRDLLARRIEGGEVWRKLRASNRVGVTRGTLEERRNPLAIL
jgi:putative protease